MPPTPFFEGAFVCYVNARGHDMRMPWSIHTTIVFYFLSLTFASLAHENALEHSYHDSFVLKLFST
jgi:hypothetical protein